MRTILCYGPPGTGKTEFCIKAVERYLKYGTGDPSRVALVSFTRKAAREARSRMADMHGFAEEELPWFSTLHSVAYRRLGLGPDDVMGEKHWKRFSEETGFNVVQGDNDPETHVPGDVSSALLRLYSVAKARRVTIEEEWRSGFWEDVPLWAAERFARELDAFKQRHKVLDYPDFIDRALETTEPLDVDLFVVDEAQDLTPQQWAFARWLGKKAESVVIAGDDDQAIYEWSGAIPGQMRRFAGIKHVLPQSHRVPVMIQRYARELIERIPDRESKEWRARAGDQGEVISLQSLEDVPLNELEGTWYLLARHNRALVALEKLVRKHGLVYFMHGKWSNESRAVRAVRAYTTLSRGKFVCLADARLVCELIPDMPPPPDTLQAVNAADLFFPWRDRPFPPWWDALRRLSLDEIAYLRALLMRGESLTEPGRIVISTVHGVKGGQADHVVLFGSATRRIKHAEWLNPSPEMRVRYVAATRARKTLFLLPGYFS